METETHKEAAIEADTSETFKQFLAFILEADLQDLRLVPDDLRKKDGSRGRVSIQGDILDADADRRVTLIQAFRLLLAVQSRLNNGGEGMCTIGADLSPVPFTFPMIEEATDAEST